MGLPNFSVKKPILIMMFLCGIILLGVISLFRLQVELYQGTARGIISIVIRVRGGLSPEEIEKGVTKPVEEAVATVSHLKSLYSNSREAESRVTLEFEPGTDMNFAALEVREKFSKAKPKLPKEIEKPVIANYSENESAIVIYAVTSPSKSPEEVRDIVDNQVRPLIARVDGVASVEVYGGRERKILVEFDRDKMFAYNISIERVMDIIGAANMDLLAGTVERGTRAFSIRTLGGFRTVEDIGDIGIATTREGSIIPLKEIATIKDSYLEPQDYARLNLTQSVSIQVKKVSDANTIKAAEAVVRAVKDYEQSSKEELKFTVIANHAKSIKRAIGDVTEALQLGVILTTFVIYLFLKRVELAFLIFLSIPISLLVTFIMMSFTGTSLNVMTLTGMAMAVGMVVDDSIVVLENMFKRREEGSPPHEAIVGGTEEMWLAILASTITTVAVFLPIMFIDKSIQLIYQGLAFTVTVALLASLLLAVSILPMLCSKLNLFKTMPGGKEAKAHVPGKREMLYRFYRKLMQESFRVKYPVLIIVIMLFALSVQGIRKMDIDLPSTLEENEFGVVVFPIAGAELESNDRVAKKVEELLRQFPEVETISAVVRKDDLRVMVKLIPRKKRKTSKSEIMSIMREKGQEAVKEIHEDYSLIVDEGVSSDEARKLIINVFGHENDKLEELAHEIAQRTGKIPGLSNIVMTDLRKRPEYDLIVDRGRAAYYGLTVKDIAESIHAQVRGMRPTKYHEVKGGQEIETITRLQGIYRQKIEDLTKIYIVTPRDREQILLEQVANFYPSFGPNTIDRMDKYRYVFVKADTTAALETTARHVKEALKDMKFPVDYFYRFGGAYSDLMKSKGQLSFAVGITILLIYMILACLFQSYTQPLIIMSAVPLAAIGIYAGLKLANKPLSEHVYIGMIILAGSVVKNSVVMIDHYNNLKKSMTDRQELLIRCGEDRLRPILMTTIATILGFVPMAIGIGQSSDLWSPLAITMIGGLTSSTILTLLIIPNILLAIDDLKWLNSMVRAKIKSLSLRSIAMRFIPGS